MSHDRVLPASVFDTHDSFKGTVGDKGNIFSFLTMERMEQVDLTRKALGNIANVEHLYTRIERGIPLVLSEAAKVAAIESSVIFLEDVHHFKIDMWTPDVFRQIRTLELMGAISSKSLEGNILLIGPGEGIYEIQGLSARVKFKDIALYREVALKMCDLLSKNPVSERASRTFVEGMFALFPHLDQSVELDSRINQNQKFVVVEPNQQAVDLLDENLRRSDFALCICQ